ncbi:hypothetical protein [Spirillospora sp. NPDC029432]|uniref:hypothetical protein n=1 Tax=Spirillospora sp. NPDC029432 TaxID=3154599 RepID=UPI003453BD2C
MTTVAGGERTDTTTETAEAARPLADLLRAAHDAYPLALLPGLGAPDDRAGYLTADDPRLWEALVADTRERYDAPAHIAAALAWKGYAYWVSLPVTLGWTLNRRVPLIAARDALVRPLAESPFVSVGLRDVRFAVTASDPCAGTPGTVVVPDEGALLALVRETLVGGHFEPLIESLRATTRAGARGLWGTAAEALSAPLYGHGSELPGAAAAVDGLMAGLGKPLAGLMEMENGSPRRRTCCLWVALPGRDACPSCCLSRCR